MRTQPEPEHQHNLKLVVRIREEGQPYGTGTGILFKGTDDETPLDQLANWLTLCMLT